jgi:SAM-dependent methyltransferase
MINLAHRLWLQVSEIWADWFRPPKTWQPWAATRADRYPRLFAAIAARLGDRPAEVLSFGCSTGEEVFSLRQYLPQARLHGIDINRAALALARRRLARMPGAGTITFNHASDTRDQPTAFYDAVFACAVFRHARLNQAPRVCAPILRFAAFEAAMLGLARIIRPGGFLVLRSANFRLADTQAAEMFDLVLSVPPGQPVPPIYGPDDGLREGLVGDDGLYCRRPDHIWPTA